MKSAKITDNVKDLPFMDPSIKWYVRPALAHFKIITGSVPAANAIQYSCDDAICLPRYYGGYTSWYDPSTNGVGNSMFNLGEAWKHDAWQLPKSQNPMPSPYDGMAATIIGYGGYFIALPLTDGTNKVHVNIIRRYIDGTILIYNTGKYGNTTVDISVTVNDPPSGLGYNKTTNGTTGTGTTTLAPGQYVLFYKGATPPAVDATTGVFQTSPFGVSKSQSYELFVNSFTWGGVNIPKMYLGVKAPGKDIEIISNDSLPGVSVAGYQSSAPNQEIDHIVIRGGAYVRAYLNDPVNYTPYNVSSIMLFTLLSVYIYKNDPNTQSWSHGHQPYGIWFGWGEDDAGNVKFIVISNFTISNDTNFNERYRQYIAIIYDVDRDEVYSTHIIKPTVDTYNYGEGGAVAMPLFLKIRPDGTKTDGTSNAATAFAFIDANDNWNKITTAATTTWTYHDNAYGFCNYHSDRINCAGGLGIYSDDPNYTPPAPKSAFGAARGAGNIGAFFIRVPSLGDRTLAAGRIYAVVARHKTFPVTATDTDLQNWFKALPPKSLTSTDYNAMLSVLPGSFWFFNQVTDTITVTAPSPVTAGAQFSVSVSCATKPNTSVWVALVDGNGNIVASGSGTTDASGNATITLTAPTTVGTYRVMAIVKGSRTLL